MLIEILFSYPYKRTANVRKGVLEHFSPVQYKQLLQIRRKPHSAIVIYARVFSR